MKMIDIAITALLVGGVGIAEVVTTASLSQCAPDEVCYPIDPNPPKQAIPPNCFLDEENGLVCCPVDQGKF